MKGKPSLFLLLPLLLLSSCQKEESFSFVPEEDATIYVASDIHYLSPSLIEEGEPFDAVCSQGDGMLHRYNNEITDSFLEEVKKSKPTALILSGDLTFNGSIASHQDLVKKLKEVQKEGIPVLPIPGNHDDRGYKALKYAHDHTEPVETIDYDGFLSLYREFGYDHALSRDSYSFSYSFLVSNHLQIILLDANRALEGYLDKKTVSWLEEALEIGKERNYQTMVVCHQNFYTHNYLFPQYEISNSVDALSLFEQYDVPLLLSGHAHFQNRIDNELTEIVTESLLVTPIQYGVVSSTPSSLSYKTSLLKVHDKNGEEIPIQDLALSHFEEISYRQAKSALTDVDLSEERKEEMALAFSKIHPQYFAGNIRSMDEYKDEIRELIAHRESPLRNYVKSIYDNYNRHENHCHFHVDFNNN